MQATKDAVANPHDEFVWKTQPAAARWVSRAIASLAARNAVIEKLSRNLHDFTGTRLVDWIDHLALSDQDSLGLIGELADIGYKQNGSNEESAWRHPMGMFPPVIVNGGRTGVALRCYSVEAAIFALPPVLGLHRADAEQIIGARGSMY